MSSSTILQPVRLSPEGFFEGAEHRAALHAVYNNHLRRSADLRRAIHIRFPNLKYSSSIGGSHVERLGSARELPGPRATLFFAPAQIKKRSVEWGANVLGRRLLSAWTGFVAKVRDPLSPWLVIDHHLGPAAIQAADAEVLGAHGNPRVGRILSLAPKEKGQTEI